MVALSTFNQLSVEVALKCFVSSGSHWPRALEIFKVAPQEAAAGQMEFDEDW